MMSPVGEVEIQKEVKYVTFTALNIFPHSQNFPNVVNITRTTTFAVATSNQVCLRPYLLWFCCIELG